MKAAKALKMAKSASPENEEMFRLKMKAGSNQNGAVLEASINAGNTGSYQRL